MYLDKSFKSWFFEIGNGLLKDYKQVLKDLPVFFDIGMTILSFI